MSGIKKGKNKIRVFNKNQLNAIILKLNTLIASIRDREKLLEFIFIILKHELGFDNATIHLWEDQEKKLSVFSQTKPSKNLKESFSIKGTPYEKCHNNRRIEFLDFSAKNNFFLNTPASKRLSKLKYVEGLIIPLFFEDNKIGIIELLSSKKGHLKTLELKLLEAIGVQMAITISNILLQEENLEKKKEKETLLKVSQAMTTIQRREDLFSFIMNQIRPVINFQDAVAVEVNSSKTHHKTFLTISPKSTQENPRYHKVVGQWLPIEGGIVSWTLSQSKDIFFSSTEKLLKLFPESIIANLMKEEALNHSLILKLYSSRILKGFIVFHFTERPEFSIEKMNVFKGLANQISMALLNILTNENALRKENEKEILLSISKAMVTIRDRDELFSFIMNQIRPIINFQDAAVVEINNQKTHHHLFLTMSPESTKEHPIYKKVIRNWIPIEGDLIEWMLEQEDDLFVSHIDDLQNLYPESSIVKTMKEISLNHYLILKLYSSGVLKGLIIFSFIDEPKIDLQRTNFFKNIANQVSMALVNIIANEDILRRQKEKEILLNISEHLSQVRQWNDLFDSVFIKLQSIFMFEEAVIILPISKSIKKYKILSRTTINKNKNKPSIEIYSNEFTKPSHFNILYTLKKPKLFSIEEYEKLSPEFIGIDLMKKTGANATWVQPLRNANNVIGILEFYYKSNLEASNINVSLFENVVNQLSVTVSNILANDDISEREKIKVLRGKLALSLTSQSNWPSRFLEITNALKKVVPFELVTFVLDAEGDFDKGYAFEKIGYDEYRLISADQFYKLSGKTLQEFKNERPKTPYIKPEIFNDQDFIIKTKVDSLKKAISNIFHVKSNLNIPLKLNLNGFFQLSFYSKKKVAYNNMHLNQMNLLIESIVHPLEKVLAYEQIEQLNSLLKQEKDYLQEEIKYNYNFEEIVGNSEGIKKVFLKVSQVAYTNSTVLITGETGTGKELIARAIHNLSSRKKKPLIKINCAALPSQLIESELFGHEKGAFTGANIQRIGKFELADNGSIFLDEIGELPIEVQAKLLRVIQEKEFERLGGNKIIKTDVRIISATNRNLEDEISKGNFRSDLFFRLNVFPIEIPPLRERPEDIAALAIYFLNKSSKKIGKKITSISSNSLKKLMGYDWPGNIRELEHVIERSILLNKGSTLSINLEKRNIDRDNEKKTEGLFQVKTFEKAERELILKTLKFCGGKVRGSGGAAELLDMNPSTLDSRIKKLGISKVHIFEN